MYKVIVICSHGVLTYEGTEISCYAFFNTYVNDSAIMRFMYDTKGKLIRQAPIVE